MTFRAVFGFRYLARIKVISDGVDVYGRSHQKGSSDRLLPYVIKQSIHSVLLVRRRSNYIKIKEELRFAAN